MELFKTVPAYSWLFFIFTNTEIYAEKYKIRRNVKTTFDKFFRCIAHFGFNCMQFILDWTKKFRVPL